MANILKAAIKAAIGITYQGDDISLGEQKGQLPFHDDLIIGSGTGSGQSDLCYFNTRTVGASSNEDVDLAASLASPIGETLTFVEITAILVVAAAGNGGNITFGPASSNGFTGPFGDASDRISLAAGQRCLLTNTGAGWGVTASTGDLLNFANSDSGAAGSYDLVIIGRSA